MGTAPAGNRGGVGSGRAGCLMGMGGICSQWREAVVARPSSLGKSPSRGRGPRQGHSLTTTSNVESYSLDLALAQREWEAANIAQVQRLLDLCAPFRRWEWERLRHLCHLEERTIPAPGNHAFQNFLCWSPDGTRLAGKSDVVEGSGLNSSEYHSNAQILDMAHEDRRAGARARCAKPNGFGRANNFSSTSPTKRWRGVDRATGAASRLWSLPVGKLGVWDMAWSLDGRYVAVWRSIGTGSNLQVWDAATGQGERVLAGHKELVYAVAWSLDSKRLVSASQDGTIRVWGPDTGASVLTLTGHAGEVRAVAWSLEGASLASAGADRRVRIWTSHAITAR